MKDRKEVEVKARVSRKTRKLLEAMAEAKSESLSLIVREAIGEYLAKRKSGLSEKKGLMIRELPKPSIKKVARYRDVDGKGRSKRDKNNRDGRQSNEGYKKPDDWA